MDAQKKPAKPKCPAKPPSEDQHLVDRDGEIYETKLTQTTPYKLRQAHLW
jgi:hypothetical protein